MTQTAMEKAQQHVAKTNKTGPLAQLQQTLDQAKQAIVKVLPKHMSPERMVRIVVSAASRNQQLLQCSPVSVAKSVIEASELGLEPSGILGHAYLVPRKNAGKKECTLQIGYKGYIELAYRSGRIKNIAAEVVYANDEFSFQRGTEQHLSHRFPLNATRGEAIGCYAVVHFDGGGYDFEVLTMDDIEVAKKASSSPRGPWSTHWDAMARKTAIRKLAKRLPLSPEMAKAADADDRSEGIINADAYVVDGDGLFDPETGEILPEAKSEDGKSEEREPGEEG